MITGARRFQVFLIAAIAASAAASFVLAAASGDFALHTVRAADALGRWFTYGLFALPLVIIGGLIGLVVDRFVSRSVGRMTYVASGTVIGAVVAIAVMSILTSYPIWDRLTAGMGGVAGLVAALIWWRHIRAMEYDLNA